MTPPSCMTERQFGRIQGNAHDVRHGHLVVPDVRVDAAGRNGRHLQMSEPVPTTPLCTGWAAVLAEIQCGRREIPADHPDAIRYGKRLESVEEFATRIAHLAASTQSEKREWVSVKDRLPEARYGDTSHDGVKPIISADVLCYFEDGIVRVGNYDHEEDYWHMVSINEPVRSDVDPTHWQPMPGGPHG